MEVGKRVRVIDGEDVGVITGVLISGQFRVMVLLDGDTDEWPFDEEELEVIG